MNDNSLVFILIISFVVLAGLSFYLVDKVDTLQQQHEDVQYYKAKADSALRIADEANSLTNQCINQLTPPSSIYERSTIND